MSDNMAYLPRVLLEALPQLRAGLTGTVHGEVLIYPFLNGCLVLCAANNFPSNGEYHLTVAEVPAQNIFAGDGFCFSLNYLPSQDPESLYGKKVTMMDNSGLIVASGKFSIN